MFTSMCISVGSLKVVGPVHGVMPRGNNDNSLIIVNRGTSSHVPKRKAKCVKHYY